MCLFNTLKDVSCGQSFSFIVLTDGRRVHELFYIVGFI